MQTINGIIVALFFIENGLISPIMRDNINNDLIKGSRLEQHFFFCHRCFDSLTRENE